MLWKSFLVFLALWSIAPPPGERPAAETSLVEHPATDETAPGAQVSFASIGPGPVRLDHDPVAADLLGGLPGGLDDPAGFVGLREPTPAVPGPPGIARFGGDSTDSDRDGIPDQLERDGVPGEPSLDFPAYGADPSVPDVFVQVDWRTCDPILTDCGPNRSLNRYRLSPQAAIDMASYYAPEVSVHADIAVEPEDPALAGVYGDWGGARRIPLGEGDCNPDILGARYGSFHRALVAGFGGGGAGTLFGYCFAADSAHGSVTAHELGHNLGLQHGGSDAGYLANCKPNHFSPMNYAYLYHRGVEAFDLGDFDTRLNPTAMNEETGMGTTETEILDILRGGPWYYEVRDDGAIDWNRNGRIDSGTVRGAPNWAYASCEQSWSHSDHFRGTGQSSMAWVPSSSSPTGARLYLVVRNLESGEVGYRSATRFDDCDMADQGESCSDWDRGVAEAARAMPDAPRGSGPTAVIGWSDGADGFLTVVYGDDAGQLYDHTMILKADGREEWSAPVAIPGATIDSDGAPALVLLPDETTIALLAPQDGALTRWERRIDQAAGFVAAGAESWDDDQPIKTCFGVGVTRGYERAGTASDGVYAAIPTGDFCTLEFARLEPDGRWHRLGSEAWSSDPPMVGGRPSLAYVPLASELTEGRFYVAWQPYPSGAGHIALTEGNRVAGSPDDAEPEDGRLRFLSGIYLTNVWGVVSDVITLHHDHRFDDNLRAAWSFIDREVRFHPFADGIVDVEMGGVDEYAIIQENLACSLTGSCNQ